MNEFGSTLQGLQQLSYIINVFVVPALIAIGRQLWGLNTRLTRIETRVRHIEKATTDYQEDDE